MTTTSKSVLAFIEGLKLLYDDNITYFMGAEHDQLFLYPGDYKEGNSPDSKNGLYLDELGFSWDEDLGCWTWFT